MSPLLQHGGRALLRPGPGRLLRPSPPAPWAVTVGGARGITDIEYYRELDQSHLHLVEAQSTMRKFQLKLRQREEEAERARRRKDGPVVLPGSQAAEAEAAGQADDTPVQVSKYIERGPTDILRALNSSLSRDFTAPDHSYHDDPYLIPYNSIQKREYLLSKDSGRRTARYVLDHHPELFEKNLIEMQPTIPAFLPRARFDPDKATEQMLETFVSAFNVTEATQVYEALREQGKEDIRPELAQSLLELLAFYNEREATAEDYNLTAGMEYKKGVEDLHPWKKGGLAEQLFQAQQPQTPAGRLAMMCGLAKHHGTREAWKLYEQCRDDDETDLDVTAYNAALMSAGDETLAKTSEKMRSVLKEMSRMKVRPDAGSLIAALIALKSNMKKENSHCCQLALSVMAEFKQIESASQSSQSPFSLGAFSVLLDLNGEHFSAPILPDVMREVQGKDWTPVRSEEDLNFFLRAMRQAVKMASLPLAYQVHQLLLHGENEVFLASHKVKLSYYRQYLGMILRHEPIDVAMDYYSKFTPHVWNPDTAFYEHLLEQLLAQDALRYLPKVWTDMQASNFAGSGKVHQTELITKVLEAVAEHTAAGEAATGDKQRNLRPEMLQITRDSLKSVTRDADNRSTGIASDAAVPRALNLVLDIAMELGDLDLARKAMDFCRLHGSKMLSSLDEGTLDRLVDRLVKEGDKETAVNCVIYSTETVMANAVELARKVTSSFEFDTAEKRQLDLMFSHDTKWQKLDVN